MKFLINMIKRALGIKDSQSGLELINTTLAGFVTIVEDLDWGANLINDDIQDNKELIHQLVDENNELVDSKNRAKRVIDNLKKLMGA